jgi:hypothetical protein
VFAEVRRPDQPSASLRLRTLVAGSYQYIINSDGQEELRDFEHDPLQQDDLAGSPRRQRTIRRFRASLEAILALEAAGGSA